MDWLIVLFKNFSVAHAVLMLSLVVSLGLALGNIRFLGINIGVGGVLFAGIALGHFHLTINEEILEFVREFGLILFVYAIGLQVGPGFFSSLRRQGLTLNLLGAAIVLGGTLIAVLIALFAKVDWPVAIGLLSGAVTNTPSLGAAQQALKDLATTAPDAASMVGLAYAMAYPFGIFGIIVTMLLIRLLFRINPQKEAEEFERLQQGNVAPILTLNYEITNPNLDGITVERLEELNSNSIVVTRIYHDGKQELARRDSRVRLGDIVHAVGTENRLESFRVIVGKASDLELPAMPSCICFRRVVVTQKGIVGKDLGKLDLEDKFGAIITRVIRSGVEFSPRQGMKLHFGDRLMVVGVEQALDRVARLVGDEVRELDRPHIVPIFVGIALGVIVGSWPVLLPHMPAPVKLGLAGGPLLVAIAMGRIGKIGPLLSYMPTPANKLLAEFGIALFLACVGLRSGERFFEILFGGNGLNWMCLAALITVIPLLVVGFVARGFLKLNYVSLCGLLSGSMTDPPALAYATQLIKSDAPSIAYATVYPLTMLLRVVIAQVVILIALG